MLKKLSIFLLLLAYGLSGHAQSYPITISTQLTQPSPIYLSNYADATTVNSPVKVQLMLNDLTISNRQVRLKCYFQGNGVSLVSNDYVVGATALYLEGGFPLQLTNVDLAPYFQFQNIQGINPNQYAQALPEGIYTFSVEVYDFATGKKLSRKTSVTTIIFQNEPPFLNLPLNNASIMQQNIQNIVFSWTPRQINVSNVEYEFALVEIWDKYTPVQNAFAYSQPLYTTTTRATTLQYSLSEPQLIPGRRYAWRIKAKALANAEEVGVFKNNGYSEIYSFTYEIFCTAPLAIETTGISQDQAKITWSGAIDNYDYQVSYREKNANSEWYKLVTPREYATISNLKPNATYEYMVGAACDLGKYTHSTIQEFTTMASDEIAFAGCGIKPDPKDLANKTPLPELFPNDVVTAGDFPIVVLKSSGSNGTFSGEGYVTLPFLEKFKKLIDAADSANQIIKGADKIISSLDPENKKLSNNLSNSSLAKATDIGKYTRIRITFNNIGVNTDFKLISGEIIASYDPSWKGIVDGDKLVDDISDLIDGFVELNFFGPNDDIPESTPKLENNTPVEVNNTPTITNPVITSPTVTNPVVTSPPIVDNKPNTTVNSSPTNTTAQSNNTTPVVAPQKVDFKSIELSVNESKTKRIAKEGQTLYYVKGSSKKTPKTDLVLTITPPNLAKDKIKNNVHWFSNNTAIDKSEGALKIKPKDLNKDATIKSVAGFPNETPRIVDVKFINAEYSKTKFTIGTSSNEFLQKALELTKIGDKLAKTLAKIPFIKRAKTKGKFESGIGFYYDMIPFEMEVQNEEDIKSRLYYTSKTISGGVELGLEGTAKFTVLGIPYDKLPLPDYVIEAAKKDIVLDIYVTAKASAGGDIKMEYVEKKMAEQNSWKKVSQGVNPAVIKLDLEFGAGANFKLIRKNEWFSIGGDASGIAKAEIASIGWIDGDFQTSLLRDGVWMDCISTGYVIFLGKKIELTPYYKKIQIIEPD
jgi:hypothetical protein